MVVLNFLMEGFHSQTLSLLFKHSDGIKDALNCNRWNQRGNELEVFFHMRIPDDDVNKAACKEKQAANDRSQGRFREQ